MAKYKSSESKSGGINSFLPKLRYRARCIGTKFGTSSSGHKMTTLSCEIIDDSIEHEGETYEPAGRQFALYLMHVQKETWGQAQVEEFCKRLKIPLATEFDEALGADVVVYDDSLHKEYFHGMEFDIVLHCEEAIKREEKKPGERVGKPILDGEGNEMKDGWRIMANLNDVPQYCAPEKNEQIASQPY